MRDKHVHPSAIQGPPVMLIAPFVRNLRYLIGEELFASSASGLVLLKQTPLKRSLNSSRLQRLADRTSSTTVNSGVMSASSVQPPTTNDAGEVPRGEVGDKSAKQLKKEAKKAEKMEKFKKKQEAAKAQGEVSRPCRGRVYTHICRTCRVCSMAVMFECSVHCHSTYVRTSYTPACKYSLTTHRELGVTTIHLRLTVHFHTTYIHTTQHCAPSPFLLYIGWLREEGQERERAEGKGSHHV